MTGISDLAEESDSSRSGTGRSLKRVSDGRRRGGREEESSDGVSGSPASRVAANAPLTGTRSGREWAIGELRGIVYERRRRGRGVNRPIDLARVTGGRSIFIDARSGHSQVGRLERSHSRC